ncbi:hypothetical protein GE21DRAFT_1127990 [Neurospora crassa]|nr:hypothetical protein GE21DRAFT_1127990 [Neurospora crassa]
MAQTFFHRGKNKMTKAKWWWDCWIDCPHEEDCKGDWRDSGQHPGILYIPTSRYSKTTLVVHGFHFHTTSRSRLPVKDHRFGWEGAGKDCRLSRHAALYIWQSGQHLPQGTRQQLEPGQSRFDLGHGPLFPFSFLYSFFWLPSLWPLGSLDNSFRPSTPLRMALRISWSRRIRTASKHPSNDTSATRLAMLAGALTAWAWGFHRTLDALNMIDASRVGVTGVFPLRKGCS